MDTNIPTYGPTATHRRSLEIAAHEAIREGKGADALPEIYDALLQEQFGDAVEVDPLFKHEWMTIPHMLDYPFYCYAYGFGDSVAGALFKQYTQGDLGASDVESILRTGGSRDPAAVLREHGNVNIDDPDFWQGAFDVYQEKVEWLKSH